MGDIQIKNKTVSKSLDLWTRDKFNVSLTTTLPSESNLISASITKLVLKFGSGSGISASYNFSGVRNLSWNLNQNSKVATVSFDVYDSSGQMIFDNYDAEVKLHYYLIKGDFCCYKNINYPLVNQTVSDSLEKSVPLYVNDATCT